METVELERFVYAAKTTIDNELLDSFANLTVGTSLFDSFIKDTLVLTVRAEIFGRTMQRIEYPRDWWQAFKARWFPGWAKRRWPVQTVRYEVREFYPQVKMPDKPHNVRFCKMGAYDDGYSESGTDIV